MSDKIMVVDDAIIRYRITTTPNGNPVVIIESYDEVPYEKPSFFSWLKRLFHV